MAAESGGGDKKGDGFNWAMLSYTYDHRRNRDGRGGPPRGGRGPFRGGRGDGYYRSRGAGYGGGMKGNRGGRNRGESGRTRSKNDVHGNVEYYDVYASEFGVTGNNFDTYNQYDEQYRAQHNDEEMQHAITKTRGHGKHHFKKGVRRDERTHARGTMERESKGMHQGKESKVMVDSHDIERKHKMEEIQQQEAEDGRNLQKKDKIGKGQKGEIINGKYVPARNKDGGNSQRKAGEFKANNPKGKSEFSRKYDRKQRNDNNQKRGIYRPKKPIDSEQTRVLSEQLVEESYECMVCCEFVRSSQAIWCCQNCYHIFHLRCIKQWVKSSAASLTGDVSGWRCPGCQNVTEKMPSTYICFCGKLRNPEWNPRMGVIPHSCGEVCKKQRTTPPCPHHCNELCHPGPCPSCPVMVTKECPCGKTRTKLRCGQTTNLKCKSTCERILNCGKHSCKDLCHEGSCNKCEIIVEQYCFCQKKNRQQKCGEGRTDVIIDSKGVLRYACDNLCSRTLDCGNHFCSKLCHPGPCESCAYLPENVEFCPCKQTRLTNLLSPDERRQSCLDPVPCCDNFCGKKLQCGSPGDEHYCMNKCHTGSCSPCAGTTVKKCRCGSMDVEIPCKDYNPDEDILCERRCNKKRKCGRHRCNQKCCIEIEHNCPLICGRKLTCGLHKCDEPCHQGNCPRCWQTSFDERTCYCGETVQYPPIPCGAALPQCKMQCTRLHPCSHEPQHNCHNEERCPPCVVLMEKRCLCGKNVRKNVPCHLNNVSCGMPCGKELPCKIHKCLKICHKGECLQTEERCHQQCSVSRRDCPHPCGAPCHIGEECPEGPCKSQIVIKCKCGRKSEKVLCLAGNSKAQYHRLASEAMGDKLRNLRSGQSIDISGLILAEKRRGLDCDEECALLERNKRLADALGIDNPETSTFISLQYSNSLKEEAKTQLPFVKSVEDAIEDLVHKIKKSSLSQISHSFPPMNLSQRKLIHEIAEHYNCKTVSYDPEPKRNTVVTATKDSVLVNTRLSTVVDRKVNKTMPNPVLLFEEKPLNFQGMQRKPAESKTKVQTIDYFDDDVE